VAITVRQLIDRLGELPDDWEVRATQSGRSLEAHEPSERRWQPGHRYGYVFTDVDQPIMHLQIREKKAKSHENPQ
jgi:hypothetical protein